MKLGEKIKERRTALGMTQKELAGDHMTRNMLSEIENGIAMPSLANLQYLATRLGVSAGYLLEETMTLFDDQKQRYYPTLQKLYHEKKSVECISLATEIFKDEVDCALAYLLACACLEEAERCTDNGSIHTAMSYLGKMEHYIGMTCLPTAHLEARGVLCRAQASDPLTPHYALDEEFYLENTAKACRDELYHYLKDDREFHYHTPVLRMHIDAKQLMREYRYTEAIGYLNQIVDNRLTDHPGVLILYRVYSDLETCYRERKDYENAYKCAGKKHTLLASFQD